MKTRIIYAGLVGIFVIITIFLILVDSGLGSYEGIHVEHLSLDGFQRFYEDNDGNLNIVKITEEDLNKVPKIKNLIKKSLEKEFSLTTDYGSPTENNTEVFASLATYEVTSYQKWGKDLGISSGKAMIAGSVLEYDGQYFRLSFTIA